LQPNNNLIREILNRIGTGIPDALSIGYKEVNAWPQPAFNALIKHGVIKPVSPANVIICPGCEKACLMPVIVYPTHDDRPARIFIACDKREDTGRIPIEPSDLEQWQIDIGRFVSLLASALDTGHSPDKIIPLQAFYLGAATINRKKRSAIFVSNKKTLESPLEAGLFEEYLRPFFLVAGGLNAPQKIKQGQLVSLQQILIFSENGLSVDMDALKVLLSTKKETRQDVISFSVPADTEWNHVFISFVNEHTVLIRVGKQTEHRSFDEMGFSDARKAVSEPSGLWAIFRELAKLNGEMTFQDSVHTFKDPEKIKKKVSQIRKKLQVVFPNIPGDPFHPYKQAKGYKTRFTLNTLPSFM